MTDTVVAPNYPLTAKWLPKLRGFSYRNRIPLLECLQESYIIEWRVVNKKIEDLRYRENYFKKVLFQRLVRLSVKDNQNRDLTSSMCGLSSSWIKNVYLFSEFESVNKEEDDDNEAVIESFVKVRPFDEVFYSELVIHVKELLLAIDEVAANMFLLRIRLNNKWSDMQTSLFGYMGRCEFYNKVSLIKKVVKDEVMCG